MRKFSLYLLLLLSFTYIGTAITTPAYAVKVNGVDTNKERFTLSATAGVSFTAGQLGYITSAGTVSKATALDSVASTSYLVVANSNISAGASGDFAPLAGVYDTTGLTPGAAYYLGETAGTYSATAPTGSGSVRRVIGYALSSTKISFASAANFSINDTIPPPPATPAVVEGFENGYSATGTITNNIPVDTQNNNLLLAFASIDYTGNATSTQTIDNSFTSLVAYTRANAGAAGVGLQAWYKLALNEPASYDITDSGGASNKVATMIIRMSNANTTTPIDAIACSTGTTEPVASPSVTTTTAEAQVLSVVVWDQNKTPIAAPTGYTLISHNDQSGIDLYASYKMQSVAGATGGITTDISADAPWVACTIAIKKSVSATAGPFSLLDAGDGQGMKITLPVNKAGVLSGNTDAYEILPSSYVGWNPAEPDIANYENALYFKRNPSWYEFCSPITGAYTSSNTTGPARSELRYMRNIPANEIIGREFSFATSSCLNNDKFNVGQIHRLDAAPLFKLSYTCKDAGAGTYRSLVKLNPTAGDTTTTLLSGITNGTKLNVKYLYNPTTEVLKFWVTTGSTPFPTTPTQTLTGVQSGGYSSYVKLGMYPNSAGDANNTRLMCVKVYSDVQSLIAVP